MLCVSMWPLAVANTPLFVVDPEAQALRVGCWPGMLSSNAGPSCPPPPVCLDRDAEDDTDMWRMCLTKHARYKALAAASANVEQEHHHRQGSGGGPEGGMVLEGDSPIMSGGQAGRSHIMS